MESKQAVRMEEIGNEQQNFSQMMDRPYPPIPPYPPMPSEQLSGQEQNLKGSFVV